MPPKRRAPAKASSDAPKRKMMTIVEKVKLLDMIGEGMSCASVARQYGVNESTVRYIKKDEENIRKTASVTFNEGAKRVVTQHNKRIVKMEAVLALWIAECRKKTVRLDPNMIRAKAKALYDQILPDGDERETEEGADPPQASTSNGRGDSPPRGRSFLASKGWFEKFQKRYGLKSVALFDDASSADDDAARRYTEEEFPNLISEGGYLPEQVFNMDKTGLFWKRMPSRTFLFKDEVKRPGFKPHKDRVTVIMCGNAAGFMLTPGLIYKAKNPRALKTKNKALLPVYWMHNPKACMTKALTLEWFFRCFVPQVRLYLAEKGLPFKVLLLMDCAGGHATDLQYDGVQIEFLPLNTSPLIQPMDQGVIRAFKALYTCYTMEGLITAVDDDDEEFALNEYWGSYDIASCLSNIQQALKDMKSETVSFSWKKLWPKAANDCPGFTPDEVHRSAVEKTLRLARVMWNEGFVDMSEEDVGALVDCHSDPLTDGDLLEMTKAASEEENSEDDEETEKRGLTVENLEQLCDMAREMQQFAQDADDNTARAADFRNRVDGVTSLYRRILEQKKRQRRQLRITMCISQETPGTSKSAAESGTISATNVWIVEKQRRLRKNINPRSDLSVKEEPVESNVFAVKTEEIPLATSIISSKEEPVEEPVDSKVASLPPNERYLISSAAQTEPAPDKPILCTGCLKLMNFDSPNDFCIHNEST
ncbi:tigger transposable element-derived protein 1-like [Syngnathoides biaculeatus]|uniref:tigger transposable element-derived protein 1-like n=1 Tax=Syngnathoides biaculeatus TaxID=300417 RepID=UPI002ADDD208|nr:tigger transposable element-derived protein 1-like [Syngnathoides biaculeatus]